MSIKQYKFVSPSVQINEIDNSQVPKESPKTGPIIIGRAERGPAMRPIRVESFSDFINIFGNPIAGGFGGDAWRDGNRSAPTYGVYAAQAWLKNNSPVNFVRLLGDEHEDAVSAGEAGWETKDSSGNATGIGTTDSAGGAYGLFLINSSSNGSLAGLADTTPQTGTLAAIFYVNQGSIVLSGTLPGGTAASGTAGLFPSIGADKEFKAIIRDKDGNVTKTTTFNFNRSSQKYIRKVFNTNPVLTNTDVSLGENTASYWLGQTFERSISEYVTNNSAGQCFGVILGLKGDSASKEASDFRYGMQNSRTGWIFCQDTQTVSGAPNAYSPSNMTKLFRFVCLGTGEWTHKNLKVSIQDIKPSSNQSYPYGTFTVVIRKMEDSDNSISVVERYSNCNLDPSSENYVAKKIGDKYMEWDDTERRYREYGNYENKSNFIRIEMNSDVDAGAVSAELLPFGGTGPVRYKGFTVMSGTATVFSYGSTSTAFTGSLAKGKTDIVRSIGTAAKFIECGTLGFTGSFVFPAPALRVSGSDGNLPSAKDAYFGFDSSISRGSTRNDPGISDMLFPLAKGFDTFSAAGDTEIAWYFTLDNLISDGTSAAYLDGSRASGASITAASSLNYRGVLDLGFDRFTVPMFGGFDGLDITEKEPFNNTDMSGKTELNNYAFNSIKRAIDCVSDPEVIECNMMIVPGVTNTSLTSHLISVCESRADALAIIDLEGGFVPSTENTNGDSSIANRGSVDTTISNLRDRGINSSYACSYYPWVQIKDSINGASLWCPPSVVALGTMASSENKTELWFAPAGFNRGGLTEGSAGIPVIGVREKLTVKQRDKLYEANINPIASFPSEGITIFGQKTLQVTQSALDRINVRRLLIYVKKEVSKMATQILFDPNTKVTWNRFLGKVEPFLRSVQMRFGLEDWKVVLDETTTTPELIDRNIMYAKVFLKPTRAIEYIAIDFSIDNTGASFAD